MSPLHTLFTLQDFLHAVLALQALSGNVQARLENFDLHDLQCINVQDTPDSLLRVDINKLRT